MSEWAPVAPPPRCDLCKRLAVFKHPAGGLRCHACPRPGQDGVDENQNSATGSCSACKGEFMLTPKGFMVKHSAPGRRDRCPGSKNRPKGNAA